MTEKQSYEVVRSYDGFELRRYAPHRRTPRWDRFDPPFVPWFLRRNEVVQDVEEGPSAQA